LNKTKYLVPSSIDEGDVDEADALGIKPSESIVKRDKYLYIAKKMSFK